jgi:group I intron endonuclease
MQKVTFYSIVRTGTKEAYVGSSINLRGRWKTHRFDLKRQKHHCRALQESYDTFGPEAFEWVILEVRECADVNERSAIELQWIIACGTYNAMSKYVTTENLATWSEQQRNLKSVEVRTKMAHDPAYVAFLAKRGNAMATYMKSSEVRANMAAHSKRRWQDPEERKRLRAGIDRWCKDESALAVHAEKGRIREANPELRAAHVARTKSLWETTEYRNLVSGKAAKNRWGNPKAKEHQAQKMREYHARRRAEVAKDGS